MNKNAAYFFLFFLIFSCASPKISNLKGGRFTYQDNNKFDDAVQVGVALVPITEEPKISNPPLQFFNLRDSLPHIFMRAVSTKETISDSFINKLAKPIILPDISELQILKTDYREIQIQLRISNIKKYYNHAELMHPNTRLEFLTTNIAIEKENKYNFSKIDKIQNEFEEIDLGQLSRDKEVAFKSSLNLNGNLGINYEDNNTSSNRSTKESSKGNSENNSNQAVSNERTSGSVRNVKGGKSITASADASYSNNEILKESLAIKLKRLKVGYLQTEKSLVIAQRGRVTGDISDNIYVNTTIVPLDDNFDTNPVYTFSSFSESSAKNWKCHRRNVSYIKCNAPPLKLSINSEGAIRAVSNSWLNRRGSNSLEFDDKVNFYKFSSCSSNIEIPIGPLCNKIYVLRGTYDSKAVDLHIKLPGIEPEIVYMIFNDFESANNLKNYINLFLQKVINDSAFASSISNSTDSPLKNTSFSLYFQDRRGLSDKIYLINSDVSNINIAKLKLLGHVELYEEKK